jgi:hypothetical protein
MSRIQQVRIFNYIRFKAVCEEVLSIIVILYIRLVVDPVVLYSFTELRVGVSSSSKTALRLFSDAWSDM